MRVKPKLAELMVVPMQAWIIVKEIPHKNQRIFKGLPAELRIRLIKKINKVLTHSQNMLRKKTIITTTREFYSMIVRPTVMLIAYCDRCRTDVAWLYVNDAAIFSRLPVRKIFGLIEAGSIHSRDTSDCQVLICHDSLTMNLAEKEN